MHDFTPDQVIIGKVLVRWLAGQGYPRDKARIEVAHLLKRYKTSKIQSLLTSPSVKNLTSLKLCLEERDHFKSTNTQDNEI